MLLSGRKLTAQEACAKGLVSQVLWPETFTQEVMVRIKELVSCNSVVSHLFIFFSCYIFSMHTSTQSPQLFILCVFFFYFNMSFHCNSWAFDSHSQALSLNML